jgi:DNA-binding transcriptional LysR family regulator
MRIDPRHLRYLRSVAESGSFGRAASLENISQPALSNKIALLEQQLGVRVLERGRHGASLNDYGNILIRYARALDALIQQAKDEVDLKKQGYEGPLVIGGTPITLIELAPRAVRRLAAGGHQIAISIVEEDDDDLVENLRVGKLDLVLSSGDPRREHPDLDHEVLLKIPIEAVVGANSPLSTRRVISLEQLADKQWVLPTLGSTFRQQVDAIFLNAGIEFPIGHWTCSSMMSLKALVSQTDSVTLMPRHAFAFEAKAGLLRSIRLRDVSVTRTIGIMTLRTKALSPLAHRFVEALRVVARGMG